MSGCSPSCTAAHSAVASCDCGCHGANHGLDIETGRGSHHKNVSLDRDQIKGDYQAQISLSPQESKALANYTGYGYVEMNGYLRGDPDYPSPPAGLSDVAGLQARYELPGHTIAMRGTKRFDQLPEGNASGQVLTVPGFTSVSLGSYVDSTFDSNIQIKMTLPKGTKGIAVEGTPHAVGEEREFLLPHNSRFLVTSDKQQYGVRTIEVRVLPPLDIGDLTPAASSSKAKAASSGSGWGKGSTFNPDDPF